MRWGINVWEVSVALMVVALGCFILIEGSNYPIGTVNQMGPGYFPVSLGVLLMITGAALVLEVLRSDTPAPLIPLRPFLMMVAGILSFAYLVERVGLVPGIVSLVVLSALGERPVRPLTIAGIAVVMSLIGVLVFIKGLGLPLVAFKW